jgi:hypothetical protein
MRGSPLLRAIVMVAVLLGLLVPLHSFTRTKSAPVAMPPAAATKLSRVHLQIVSTAVPFTFAVSHLGKVVWQGDSPTSPVGKDVNIPFPKEGIDLAMDVKWPAGGTAAVKLSVTRDDEDPVAKTIWGDGAASDVLTFP